jgi:hypothetical protein
MINLSGDGDCHFFLRRPEKVAVPIVGCGWSLTIVVAALELVRHPTLDFERTALWLGFWIVVGLRLAFPLLWTAGGKNELIRVDSATLAIERRIGPFKQLQRLHSSSIRDLRVEPSVRSRIPDWHAIRRFWSGGVGRVRLESGGRSYGFGDGLSETEAAEVIGLIRARMVQLDSDTAGGEPVNGRARPAFGLGSFGLTTALLIPALTLPLGLALTDRPICFCNDTIPPDEPVDVSAIQPSRRVYLVPLDMYIPSFPWRYAFSYRRQDRLAVVSTARMDRGCLGLFTAGKERRLARLRKMVGKNLGVLYFGLPLSDDPRSLLYANIGGPQELDVMSEIF